MLNKQRIKSLPRWFTLENWNNQFSPLLNLCEVGGNTSSDGFMAGNQETLCQLGGNTSSDGLWKETRKPSGWQD